MVFAPTQKNKTSNRLFPCSLRAFPFLAVQSGCSELLFLALIHSFHSIMDAVAPPGLPTDPLSRNCGNAPLASREEAPLLVPNFPDLPPSY